MTRLIAWRMTGAVVAFYAAMAATAAAQTFTVLLSFDNHNGALPRAALVKGRDGNFYGTTSQGGDLSCNGGVGCGTVFRITSGGILTTLHRFNSSDGFAPSGSLLQAVDGNFYGTTGAGGSSSSCMGGCGTIFKITPHGRLTTLHSFDLSDGAAPVAGLIRGIDGNFYGTTVDGGNGDCNNGLYTGCGIIFKMTAAGALTVLTNLNGSNGAYPFSLLIQATDGKFYGTTSAGGGSGPLCSSVCGTIFKITPAGKLTTLHTFKGTDGLEPLGGLIQANDGDFYGTTVGGGAQSFGTVYRVNKSGLLTTLHSFDSNDGCSPDSALVQATDGNFYGTTFSCGPVGTGTIFNMTPGGTLITLHYFCSEQGCADGFEPDLAALIQDTSGTLYGTIHEGGSSDKGTVFSLDMGLGPFVTFVRAAGKVGQTGPILGQGFTGTTSVMLNGVSANFTVVSDTYIRATVPPGATTGYVTVTTPSGTLTSNVPFHVIP